MTGKQRIVLMVAYEDAAAIDWLTDALGFTKASASATPTTTARSPMPSSGSTTAAR
jgi:hypothetical protein